MTGRFITFEGIECSGKGEQSHRLSAYLKQPGQEVILTREPGGTIYGEALRALLKHPVIAFKGLEKAFSDHDDFTSLFFSVDDFYRSAYTELFMFMAARSEFVDKLIKPALSSGAIVIADRFSDSTRAYQGGGRFNNDRHMVSTINFLNVVAVQGVIPDLTFFLDITIEEMIKRRKQVSDKDAFFERSCDRAFFERTRQEYLQIAQDEPERFIVIDGSMSIEAVHQAIIGHIIKLPFKEKKNA